MDFGGTSNSDIFVAGLTSTKIIIIANGCVVECRICNRGGCGFESQLGLLHTKVYSAFHPSGSVNEYQLRLGRQRQVWLIQIERLGVQVKF